MSNYASSAAKKAAKAAAKAAQATAAQAATATAPEAPVTTLATVEQSAPVEQTDTVFKPFIPAFGDDGETMLPIEDTKVTAQQLGDFVIDTVLSSEKSTNRAAWALYHANQLGDRYRASVEIAINSGKPTGRTLPDGKPEMEYLTAYAVSNLKNVAGLISFKLAHSIKAPLSVLKDAAKAVRTKAGEAKSTPEANALMFLLKEGGTGLQAKIREERKRFDKDGSLKLVALPAPVASETARVEQIEANAAQAPESPATPLAPSLVDGIRNETAQAAQAASEAAQQPRVAPPVVKPITEAEKLSIAAIGQLDRVREYITAHSIVGEERDSFVTRIKAIATLLGLALA
jgi:hypothetical protein